MGLIFLIKITFIPVCSKKQSLDPGRGSPHLLTEGIQGYTGAAFDNQFVMHMTADEAVGKGLHGISQDITAYCLDDVLHEFGSVAFNPSPFSSGSPFIGHALRAELVHTHTGLNIGEPSAGWEIDKEHRRGRGGMECGCGMT